MNHEDEDDDDLDEDMEDLDMLDDDEDDNKVITESQEKIEMIQPKAVQEPNAVD